MRARIALAGGVLAVLALPSGEGALAWQPAEGATLSRTFREETDWSLTAMNQTAGGAERELDVPELSGLTRRALEVVDELVELGEGRPALLRRTVAAAEKSSTTDFAFQDVEESYDFELETPLSGQTVTFRWDEGDEDWRVDSEHVDSGLLEGLREDLDLRALLPDEPAGEGSEWTVDLETLIDVLRPGGALGFTRDSPPEGPYAALTATDVIATSLISAADVADAVWGELRLEWSETREEDGRTLAVIELELEGDLSADVTERIARLTEESSSHGKRDPELSVDWEVEGKGQLVWDLAAGHFASFELAFEGPAAVEMAWVEGGERPYDVELTVGLDIATVLRAEVSAE